MKLARTFESEGVNEFSRNERSAKVKAKREDCILEY